MAKLDLHNLLLNLPLFAGLEEADIQLLLNGCREVRVRSGGHLVERGTHCDGFFVVVVGKLKLSIPSASGQEKVVELVGPRQSFGEAVTVLNQPFFMNAQALEDTLLLHFDRKTVLQLCAQSTSFSQRLLVDMCERWLGLMKDVEAFSLQSAAERVVSFLLERPLESTDNGFKLELPANKNLIASRLNLKPETLSRIFSKLTCAGHIRVDGRTVHIQNPESLRKLDLVVH